MSVDFTENPVIRLCPICTLNTTDFTGHLAGHFNGKARNICDVHGQKLGHTEYGIRFILEV
jgi:hypothetical protein